MDQNRIDDDFSENGVNVYIPLKNTNNEREKSNKCNQCDYASSQAGNLGSYLKTHSGEEQINAASVTLSPVMQAL